MNKVITLLIIGLLSNTGVNAQWWKNKRVKGNGKVITKNIQTNDYDAVLVTGSLDVNLVEGKEGDIKVKIEENLFELLNVESKNGTLEIKWKNGTNISTTKGITIEVPIESINKLKVTGSGDIIGKHTLNAMDFETQLSGSGSIDIKVKSDKFKSIITGSGDMTISGKTSNLEVTVSGSGEFHGSNLETNDAKVELTGSGDVSLYVTNSLTGIVTGSGDIGFKGTLKLQDIKITGSGEVSRR